MASILSKRSRIQVKSGRITSTPGWCSSGNKTPQSTTRSRPACSKTVMLRPISPTPPRGTTRSPSAAKVGNASLRLGARRLIGSPSMRWPGRRWSWGGYGVGAAKVAVAKGGTVHLQVATRGGVPATGVSAVVLNVTVTAPTKPGYVTVYGDGTTRPTASNLNFVAGQTIPNLVIAPVGANGKVALYNGTGGTIHLIADVSGYYRSRARTATGAFGALAPYRLLDTRYGLGAPKVAVAAGGMVALQVTMP